MCDWSPFCMHTNFNCTREILCSLYLKTTADRFWSCQLFSWNSHGLNIERLALLVDQVVYPVVIICSDSICIWQKLYFIDETHCLHCGYKQLINPSAQHVSPSLNTIVLDFYVWVYSIFVIMLLPDPTIFHLFITCYRGSILPCAIEE